MALRAENRRFDDTHEVFFAETSAGSFVPRAIFADLDPEARDLVRNHPMGRIFHLDFVVVGDTNAASSFGRGRELARDRVADKVMDRVRKQADAATNLQGFVLFHASGGGTGSGLGAELLDRLALDYRKKSVISFTLLPSFVFQRAPTETYNTMFTLAKLRTRSSVSFVFDNDALYRQCQRLLDIKDPSLADLTRLIGQAAADITSLLRYPNTDADLNTLQTSLVIGPGRHFIAVSSAPRATRDTLGSPSVLTITDQVFAPQACLGELDATDMNTDRYIAAMLIYRGKMASKEINASLSHLKSRGRMTFVENLPTGLKSFVVEAPPRGLRGDTHVPASQSVTLLTATTAMATYFGDRIDDSTKRMHERGAFMQWFIGANMDADDFVSARADLEGLIEGYADLRP